MTIRLLGLEEVLALHADQIDRYGGSAGVRDLGLLESAVAAPESSFGDGYLHGSLPEMAAAYLFHLAQNHAFVDGNKRVAAAAMIMFVYLNDHDLECDEDGLVERSWSSRSASPRARRRRHRSPCFSRRASPAETAAQRGLMRVTT